MLRSKSLFQVIGYLLKFEFLRYLKKYSLGPYAEKKGQNRSTGISRRPEFPACEKKRFFQNISKSKTPNNQSLKLKSMYQETGYLLK